MFVETLAIRISQAIDELAKLLDCLHRFPYKLREEYYQKIKKIKNQLIALKNNLKQTNALHTERLYTSLYLTLNSLKTEIHDQASLLSHKLANKQNRDVNRSHSHSKQVDRSQSIRQSKRTHEDALRLIADKQDEIAQYKLALFEKEELIRINYEQLRDYQRECAYLRQQNIQTKVDNSALERQLGKMKEELTRKEEEALDLKLQTQDQQHQIRTIAQELQICRSEMMSAREKIYYFQQLAEISMAKTRIVEENIRQVEQEAQALNHNFRAKETQNIKKHKEIQQLALEIRNKDETIRNLREENSRTKEDMAVMEAEMTKLQKNTYEIRLQNKQEKESHHFQEKELNGQIQRQKKQKQKLIEELRESQNKFIDIYNKFTESEEDRHAIRQTITELMQEKAQLTNKMSAYQDQLRNAEKQLLFSHKQTSIRSEQVEKSLKVTKEYQTQILKLKEIIKSKEQLIKGKEDIIKDKDTEKTKLNTILQNYLQNIRSCERDKTISERSINSLTEQIRNFQIKTANLQDTIKRKQQEIIDIKTRLLRAKIQTIHQLRESIRDN